MSETQTYLTPLGSFGLRERFAKALPSSDWLFVADEALEVKMKNSLSELEAFQAMVEFLDCYYERGGGKDTLGDVLSSISQFAWADGTPNDPASWQDWLDAISNVKRVLPR